jgi:WD40 repeat protein
MENKKPPLILFLQIVICTLSIYALGVRAEQKPAHVAYTQASLSNLRSGRSINSEIVQKLPINTEVHILDKNAEWIRIELSGKESVQGWLNQSLVAIRPLPLEEALQRYDSLPESSESRLTWIERAAAIAPKNTDVLNELVQTLQFHKEFERADQVSKTIAELKTSQPDEPLFTIKLITEVFPSSGAFALSGDGKIAAHINPKGEVVVWEGRDPEHPDRVSIKDTQPTAIALNENGSKLAVGFDNNQIIVWSIPNKRRLLELRGHLAKIISLAFSPDGKLLASGAYDATAGLWNLESGEQIHSFNIHLNHYDEAYGTPVGLYFANEGNVLIVSEWLPNQYGEERAATMWNTKTGQEVSSLPVAPPNLSIAPERSGLALGGQDTLLVITESERLKIQRLDQCEGEKTIPTGSFAETVAVDPLGRWVAYASGGSLSFFNAGKPDKPFERELPGIPIKLSPYPDGKSIIAIVDKVELSNNGKFTLGSNLSNDGKSALFRVPVPEQLLNLPPIDAKAYQTCRSDQKGPQPLQYQITKNPVRLLETAHLEPTPELISVPVSDLFFNSNGVLHAYYHSQYYGEGNETKSGVVTWNVAEQTPRESRIIDYPSSQMSWRLPDGWAEQNSVISHALTGETICHPKKTDMLRSPYIAVDPDTGSIFVANQATGDIEHCRPDGNVTLSFFEPIHAIAARNHRLAAAFGDSKFQIWKIDPYVTFPVYQQQEVLTYYPDGDGMDGTVEVESLELSPDGQYLKIDVSSPDAPIRTDIFNVKTGEKITASFLMTSFQNGTDLIVTRTDRSNQLAIWDMTGKHMLAVVPTGGKQDGFHDGSLKAAINNDGRYLLTSDSGSPVFLWDISENKLLGSVDVRTKVTSLAFDLKGKNFAVGLESGEIRVYQIPGNGKSDLAQEQIQPSKETTPVAYENEQSIYITGSNINARKYPNIQSRVFATLPIGMRVTYHGNTKDRYPSRCRDKGKETQNSMDWICFSTQALDDEMGYDESYFWAVSSFFSQDKPRFKDLIEKYDFTPPENKSDRRKWAERAVALRPVSVDANRRLIQTLEELNDTDALAEANETFARYQEHEPSKEDNRKLIFVYNGFIHPYAEIVGDEIKPWSASEVSYLRPRFTSKNETFHRRGEFYHLYSGDKGKVGTLSTIVQFDCALRRCPEDVPVRYLEEKKLSESGPGKIATNFLLPGVGKRQLEITDIERNTVTHILKEEIASHSSDKEKSLLLDKISSKEHIAIARQLAPNKKKILIGSVSIGSENSEKYGEDETYAVYLVIAEEQDDGSFVKAGSPSAKELKQISCEFNSAIDLDGDGTDEIILRCDRLEGSYHYALLKRVKNRWEIGFMN